jgi:hypothetical protein
MPKKEMKFIACTPKFIPVERMDEAAELAVSINPSNRPPVEQMAMAATRAIKAAEADESFTASDVPADVAAAVLLPDPGMLAFLTTKYRRRSWPTSCGPRGGVGRWWSSRSSPRWRTPS